MKKYLLISINLLFISTLAFGQISPNSSSVLIEPNNTNGILSKNSTMVSYDAYLSQPLAASGGGTRLMWIPAKSAFRAGTVLSTNWDASNIGTWSFATGFNTLASGRSASAFGNQTNATQQYATAFGTQTTASGFASTAFGESTTASGSVALAIGSLSTASGPNSFAAGQETTASGFRSAAFGWQTNASGTASFALGASTIASGNHAVSMGKTTTASGENAVAMGEGTTALAYSSLAVGTFNDEIYSSSPTTSNPADPLFILGNGTDINHRSNAMMVLKNGSVGIGTNAPNDKLVVKTATNAYGITHTDGIVGLSSLVNEFGGFFGTKSNHSLNFITNAVSKMTLTPSGSVGIGTPTPDGKLEILASTNNLLQITNSQTLSSDVRSSMYFKTGNRYTGVIETRGESASASTMVFKTTANTDYTSLVTRMVIKDNGNVGINTLSPTSRLHVQGNTGVAALEISGGIKVSGNSKPAFQLAIDDDNKITYVKEFTNIVIIDGFVIDNALSNNNPNALIFVTPVGSRTAVEVSYNTTTNKWECRAAENYFNLTYENVFCTAHEHSLFNDAVQAQTASLIRLTTYEPRSLYLGTKYNILIINQ